MKNSTTQGNLPKSLFIELFQAYVCNKFNYTSVRSWREDMHGVSAEISLSAMGVETAKRMFSQVFHLEGFWYNVRLCNSDMHNEKVTKNFNWANVDVNANYSA